jgi:hypothetical protein
LASSSEAWTCFRMDTKCEDSFSAAWGVKRGAQRLFRSMCQYYIFAHLGRH